MNAGQMFKSGKLREAIDAQTQEVKAQPGDQNARLFLFELLAFAGDLERARRQLDALKYDDPELENTLQTYRHLLDAEQLRRNLFAEGLPPRFFGAPPATAQLRLEAVNRLRTGSPVEAADLVRQASAAEPDLQGSWNGQPFRSLRDWDDRFGPILEVMAHGIYFWVPLEQVQLLHMKAPRFPRDLLWIPATLELAEEAGPVYLPTLYPGSYEQPDDRIRLGHLTDSQSLEGGLTLGLGQRTFYRDEDEVGILECRQLEIRPATSPDAPETPSI